MVNLAFDGVLLFCACWPNLGIELVVFVLLVVVPYGLKNELLLLEFYCYWPNYGGLFYL